MKEAFKDELNKSESLRDLVATAAVGCLLPNLSSFEDDMFVYGDRGNEGNKDEAWELKKRFMNTRQIYHESWVKHQKATYDEYKENSNPTYSRMQGDLKKLVQNELSGEKKTTKMYEEAMEPQKFPSLLKRW